MPVDQRVTELPLGTGDLKTVALERNGAGTTSTQLLALDDELRDLQGQRFHGRAAPASPKARRTDVPQRQAACHVTPIGRRAQTGYPPHGAAGYADRRLASRGHASRSQRDIA